MYRIKAINEHGEVSEISDWVRADTPPAVPVPDKAHGTVCRRLIQHRDPHLGRPAGRLPSPATSSCGADRAIHPTGTFVTIAGDTGSAQTAYTDETVEPDKEYVYRIKAINDRGLERDFPLGPGLHPGSAGPGGLVGEVTGGRDRSRGWRHSGQRKEQARMHGRDEAGVSNPESERSKSGADKKGDAWARIGESRWLRSGRNSCAMPRQRTHHSRRIYDFPQRLVRFKEESDLPWAELNRRLGTDPHTVRRWRDEGVRPSVRHFAALLNLAGLAGPRPPVHRVRTRYAGEWLRHRRP